MKKILTSESVTCGHPDKLCDLISDSILDSYLSLDKNARVACETVVTKAKVFVTGQITSSSDVDIESVVRDTIKKIGYFGSAYDIDYKTCQVEILINKQSEDINLGTNSHVGGAGDQGIMVGFACDETKEYMPFPIITAHKLAKRLEEVRNKKIVDGLLPDGKVQVSVEYEDDIIKRIDAIVLSTQHKETINLEELTKNIKKHVISSVIDEKYLDENTKYYINPTGRFVIGGPLADTGLTGRKIIVDTYGGYAHHGGGAFSGKDPTKVDRSAAYMARFLAKNIVANGMAKKCEIQLAYAIGIKEPISIFIDTFGTSKIPEYKLIELINSKFDLTPKGIIKLLKLDRPIYKTTTNYGHFGKDELEWEKIINLKCQ